MNTRCCFAIVLGLAFSAAYAQDAPVPAPDGQGSTQNADGSHNAGQGRRGGLMGDMGMAGRGVMGTVTAVGPDFFTVKAQTGNYAVHFSANTRIFKQRVMRQAPGPDGGPGGAAPVSLKPSDIKIGDAIAAMGEVDLATRSVGAMTIIQIDPERARQMREMQANYGKTWLAGKVSAIDGMKVTIVGSVDNAPRTFVVNENTSFRKRRDPITLADVQVGDLVRIDGAMQGSDFAATGVTVMPMRSGVVPRDPNAPAGPVPNRQ
jgi:hypothetical protein